MSQKFQQAFKQVTLAEIDQFDRIKKPSKDAFKAAKMLSLLVNFFREPEKQFDLDEFNDWLQLQGFMLYSPSASKFFKDLQQIKTFLLTPTKLPD